MNAGLISLGVGAIIVTIFVVVRLATRRKNRNPRYTGTYRGGGGCGPTGSAGTTPSSEPSSYDAGYAGYYSFTHHNDSTSRDHGHDHSSHHYTPEAPSSYGDIGSVDSGSSGCDSGGGGD